MKKCPQCNSLYSDDLSFCLEDGTALAIEDEQTTVVMSSTAVSPVRQGVSPVFAYLTFGLLVFLIGGVAVFWLMSKNDSPTLENKTEKTQNQSINNDQPVNTQTPRMTSPSLTADTVRSLLNTWEKAQDTRNFPLYKFCYDTSFRGIKRTVSGSAANYDYDQWLDDRRKMMSKAKFLEVRVEKLQISIEGDAATAEFEQYFRTNGYADFGPKIIKIKMSGTGAKIVYEELKSSTLLSE